MAETTVIKTIFQFKRGTADRWKELNLVLEQGEPGFEYDTNLFKIGNGITPWNDLPYQGGGKEELVVVTNLSDLPVIGDSKILYRVDNEKALYQWNESTSTYEPLNGIQGIQFNGKEVTIVNNIAVIEGEYFTKNETTLAIATAITDSMHLKKQIVDVLPEPAEAKENVLYMILDPDVAGNDKYKEYMLIGGSVVLIGDTSTDLTNYVTKDDLAQIEVGDKNVIETITLGGEDAVVISKTVNIPLAAFDQETLQPTVGLIKPNQSFSVSEGQVSKISIDLLDSEGISLVFDCGNASI